MLLSYRDPHFWKHFHARHWAPQVPTVLRQPFKNFPFSEDLLLRSLKGFAAGVESGDLRKTCLVSVGDKETSPRRPLKTLLREPSHSMEELEANCARVFPKKNFGLMVTQMQAVDPGVWNGLTSFLQDASPWMDVPAPRAFVDLFYGNYKSNFTGLHKDTQEIIAFVIRGKKRMLAWPFEYFLSRVDGVTAGDKYFNKRLPIDHRKYRKDALVLDAEAGDVLYWPSHYWHVSEVQDGQFSGMLSLGIFRPEIRLSESATSKQLVSRDMTQAASRTDAGRQLRWMTSFGFELGGPLPETAPARRAKVATQVTVAKTPNSVILWKVNNDGRVLVASNGHSVTVPHSKQLVALLERIAQGGSVTVIDGPTEERSKFTETNWNKKLQFKTRTLTSGRDPSAWLVDWLRRILAVEEQ